MTPASAPRRVQGLGTTGMAAGTAVSFAVLAIVASPTLAIALLVAAVGAIAVLVDVRWAVVAIAAFTVLRIPEVGADFYGWSTLLLPLIALIGLGLAVWIRRRGTTPGQSLTTAWVAGLFVAVAAVSLIGAAEAAAPVELLRGIGEDAALAVLIGLIVGSTESLRRLTWAIVGCGSLLALLSLAQMLTGSFSSSWGGLAQSAVGNIVTGVDDVRIAGSVGDPNYYAQWLVLIIPLAIDRWRDESNPWLRRIALAGAAGMAAAAILTFSRGGLIGLAVVAVFAVIELRPRRAVLAAAGLGLVAVFALAPSNYVGRIAALADVGTVSATADPSMRIRTAAVVAGWAMFIDNPATGVGYSTYAENYPEYTRDLGIEQRAVEREAHNLYLQFAAEMGLPGIGLLMLLGGAAVIGVRRGRRGFEEISDHTGAGISRAVAASLAAYAATSLFLHLDFARLPWLLLGIALVLPDVARREDEARALAAAETTR